MAAYIPLARLASAAERGGGGHGDDSSGRKSTSSGWKIEKEFKVGDELRCRVVAANLMEGLPIATAIPNEVRCCCCCCCCCCYYYYCYYYLH